MFEKIRYWYMTGMWTIDKVRNAVGKGKISKEQYKEITGEDYDG